MDWRQPHELDWPRSREPRCDLRLDRCEQAAHINSLAIPYLDERNMLIAAPVATIGDQPTPQFLFLSLQLFDRCTNSSQSIARMQIGIWKFAHET
jgi:hypothetical protein